MFVTAGYLDAQISTEGTVRGVVRDAGGGVLPGVTVTAVSSTIPGTHISVSESDGQYRLLNLPPGLFDVAAELQHIGAAEQVIGGENELRHFERPVHRGAEQDARER